jgi:multiple sugar transport system ATP-binding protein
MNVAGTWSFPLKIRKTAQGGDRGAPSAPRGEASRLDPLLDRKPESSCPAASASASPWAAPSCAEPKVFLFDEPLSNLDAKLRVEMRTEIKDCISA